jgi:murein DD-endopeptidase MepM/ murein hydrolase activator NlpD
MKKQLFFTKYQDSKSLSKKRTTTNKRVLIINLLFLMFCVNVFPQSNYKLPFTNGTSYVCSQGNNGSTSHYGIPQYAFDFAMPINSNVCAAHSGVVTQVVESYSDYNNPTSCNDVNRVVISHGDGTSSLYLHLTYNGALVNVGESVTRGQVIAKSGSSGCSTGPHLHFMVMNSGPGTWYNQSLPISFCDYMPNLGVPTSGAMCIASSCSVSTIPDLISQNGAITQTSQNTVTFSVTIKNNGTATASSTSLGFLASANSDLSFAWTIGANTVNSLAPGETFTVNRTINLCDAATPLNSGTYYVGFKIDRLEEVTESNESNNIFVSSSPVTIDCSQSGTGGNASVQVYLVCSNVITDGGQWAIDGGIWRNSNEIVNNLSAGNHIVSFKNIPNWIAPPSYSFTLTSGENKIISGSQSRYTKNFNLILNSNPNYGGTTIGAGTFNVGCMSSENVNISATPAIGWQFDSWTENGNIVSYSPNITISISENRNLVANFSQIIFYTISTIPNPPSGGGVTNGGSFDSGSSLSLNAFPNTGWVFDNWTENSNIYSTNPQATVLVNQNRTFTANFSQIMSVDNVTFLSIHPYPNPTSGIINFQNSFQKQVLKIQIFDLTSRFVFEPDFEINENNISFDLGELNAGIYFAQILLENNKRHFFKIIKE